MKRNKLCTNRTGLVSLVGRFGLIVGLFSLTSLLVAQESTATSTTTLQYMQTSTTSTLATQVAGFNMSPSAGLIGAWRAEKAILELFGNLKELNGTEPLYFSSIRFDSATAGAFVIPGKIGEQTFEFDIRDGQLTIAYGSRLRPQIDLFRFLPLSDGSLYLRSTRLSGASGGVTYILRRTNTQ